MDPKYEDLQFLSLWLSFFVYRLEPSEILQLVKVEGINDKPACRQAKNHKQKKNPAFVQSGVRKY